MGGFLELESRSQHGGLLQLARGLIAFKKARAA